ncbi:hypothetical protein KGF56_000784 [Candida oxycetoniae]|uniref:Uncharacterized protein n=1 Tax=Candida oxycetoniae TaxID=497107 RepID=A0AAI9T0E7_9ASCO|nr:uncharacterized protein KGF56_000784 [Candida oxycetoniae]KAI3406304.2 hypothetical protein KGF56_000784 [Candida oxycetoniae]
MGKNHIKYYCDYYELKAKETGEWNPSDLVYEITFDKLNRGIPGGDRRASNITVSEKRRNDDMNSNRDEDAMDIDSAKQRNENGVENGEEQSFSLPPPPHLNGLPLPPPAVFNNVQEHRRAILKCTKHEAI